MENKSCVYGLFVGMMILIILVRPITMEPRIEDTELQGITTKAKNEQQNIMDPLSISSISMQAKLHKRNANNDDGLLNSEISQAKSSNTDTVYSDLVVYNHQNNQNMEKPVGHQFIDPVMSPLIGTLTSGKFMTAIPQGYGDSEMYLFQRMDPLSRSDKQGLQSNVRAVGKLQTDDVYKVERIFDRLQLSNFSRNHLRAPSLEIQDNLKTLVLNWLRQNKSNVNQKEHIGFSIKNIYNQFDTTSQLHKLQTTEYPTTDLTTIYPTKTATTVDITTTLTKAFPTTFPKSVFPTKSPTTAFPTSAYPTKISTTVYPETIPTTVYSTTIPTKVYPTTTPTTVFQSKPRTTGIPSKTPTAVYSTTMPTTVYSTTIPTSMFQSKHSTTDYHTTTMYLTTMPIAVFQTKTPTTGYSSKIPTTVYSTTIPTMYLKTTLTTLNPARKIVLSTSKLPKTTSNPTSISIAQNVHTIQGVRTQNYIFKTDLPPILNLSKTIQVNQNDMVNRKSKESPDPELEETFTLNENFDYMTRNIIPRLNREKDYLKRVPVEYQHPSPRFPNQFQPSYSTRLNNDQKETAIGKQRMESLAESKHSRAVYDEHRHKQSENNRKFQSVKGNQTKRKSSDENNSITKVMVLPKAPKASTAVDIEDLLINFYHKGNKYNLFSRSEIEQQTNVDHQNKLDNEKQSILQHSDNGFNRKHSTYKTGDKKHVWSDVKKSSHKGLPVAILEFIYDHESTALKDFHSKPHKEPLQLTMKQNHVQPKVEVRTFPTSARVYSYVEQSLSEQKLKSRDDHNIKLKHAKPKVEVRTLPSSARVYSNVEHSLSEEKLKSRDDDNIKQKHAQPQVEVRTTHSSARVYSNVEQNLSEQKLKSRDDYNMKHGIELLNKLFYSGLK